MKTMGATDLVFITISQTVSFVGKTWWVSMLVLRLLVLLLAGFSLFSDEQERFVCNTVQPGCSNVCFDVFAPVSVFRLWLFHLLLLCLPHVLFATYVSHKVLSCPEIGSFCRRLSSPFERANSSVSRELSLRKASLRCPATPRFYGAYFLVVITRILLEVVFGAGQFLLFGLTVPKRFLCYESPCTSGVECYISRRTEKTLMLNFMLGVATLSVLLSLVDLVSSTKAMLRWKRHKEMFTEEMNRGEQSSVFTTTTTTLDSDVLSRKISLGGSLRNGVKEEKHALPNGEHFPVKVNGGMLTKTGASLNEERPESKDVRTDVKLQTPPIFVHRGLRAPLCPRPDRGPPPDPRVQTPAGVRRFGQILSPLELSRQHSESSGESQERRAWV